MNRALLANERLHAQGRPLGHLVAWLLASDDSTEWIEHFSLRRGRGPHELWFSLAMTLAIGWAVSVQPSDAWQRGRVRSHSWP